MRQFVVLITVAEVPSIGVQVKNAVILLNDSFLSLSRSLSGNDVKFLSACRHHTHELYACAHSCFAACGSPSRKSADTPRTLLMKSIYFCDRGNLLVKPLTAYLSENVRKLFRGLDLRLYLSNILSCHFIEGYRRL